MLARVFAAAPVATELLVRALPPPPKKEFLAYSSTIPS